jgi:hypothetical protein
MKRILLIIASILPVLVNGQVFVQSSSGSSSNVNGQKIYGSILLDEPQNGINNFKAVISDITALSGNSNTGTDLGFTHTYEAFKFTTTDSINVLSFGVFAKAVGIITNPTDYWYMWLYTDNSGSPGTKIGTIQENARFGGLTASYQEIRTQTTNTGLHPNTSYWIVLQRSNAPTGGIISLDTKNTGTAQYAFSTNGTEWTTGNNVTGRFILYAPTVSGLYISGSNYPSIDVYNSTEYGIRATSTYDYGGLFIGNHNGGMSGQSIWGPGSLNTSTYFHGVYGVSTYGYGGFLIGKSGLFAQSTSISNTDYAIRAYAQNEAYGLYASADSNYGVYGSSQISGKSGVYGISNAGYGVLGESTSSYGGYFKTSSGNALYATTAGSYTFASSFMINPSLTNNTVAISKFSRQSSGSAAAGIGGSLDIYVENGTGSEKLSGKISTSLTNVTNTAEEGNVKIGVIHSGANIDRVIYGSKVLADNSATGVCTIALPTLAMCGGTIEYTITSTEGTDMQSVSGIVKYQYVNKAASYTGTIELASTAEDDAVSAGTLTGAWTITTGTDLITINANYNSSLTAPTIVVYYVIKNNSKQAVTIL